MPETNDTAAASEPGPDARADGVRPLIAELRLLVQDVTTLARSEVAFQTARARVVGAGVRGIALCGLFALVLAVFALGALTVGLLLALTPLVTAWGATAIVAGLLLAGAGLCMLGGWLGWRRMKRILSGEPRR